MDEGEGEKNVFRGVPEICEGADGSLRGLGKVWRERRSREEKVCVSGSNSKLTGYVMYLMSGCQQKSLSKGGRLEREVEEGEVSAA
jgi:hypothetical protein